MREIYSFYVMLIGTKENKLMAGEWMEGVKYWID